MDLTRLDPGQLAQLKAQLDSITDVTGRSPLRPRQLHNLTLLPTATDPRPTFFWSAESPRDQPIGPGTPYPKLLWHQGNGTEVTVRSQDEEASYGAEWASIPPSAKPIDPLAGVQDIFAGLSDDERALLIEAQKADRMTRLRAKLADLSEGDLERLLAQQETGEKRGRKKAVA